MTSHVASLGRLCLVILLETYLHPPVIFIHPSSSSVDLPSPPPPSLELAISETSNMPASAYISACDFFL